MAPYTSDAVVEESSYNTDQFPIKREIKTHSVFMNLPIFQSRNQVPGFFIAPYTTSANWNGAVVFKTNDDGDNWFRTTSIRSQSLVATITQAPGEGVTTRWDYENTITIRSLNYHKEYLLESASLLSVLAGTNTAAIGKEGEGWEIISFADVQDNNDGTYTLSTLLRGRRGTEKKTSATKNTFVLLLTNAIAFVEISSEDAGVQRGYKVCTIGKSLEKTTTRKWSSNGDSIKPWNPVFIRGTRNSSGDITITWLRRSRGEDSWNTADVPLFENTESYEVDILDGSGNVIRTLSTNGINSDQSGVTYTATQQNDDFGSLQSSVDVAIYQLSDVLGRGFPGKSTI